MLPYFEILLTGLSSNERWVLVQASPGGRNQTVAFLSHANNSTHVVTVNDGCLVRLVNACQHCSLPLHRSPGMFGCRMSELKLNE
jgi:hypothetical protein